MSIIDSNPLVSIAVATYNGAEFLAPQLETLTNQTYKNLEIVICDDASTDDTHAIIEAYQKLDSRIKFFPNRENLGFNLNFERTLKHCTGEYIAISDQDDIWVLDKIEIVLRSWELGVLLVHHSTKTFETEPLPNIEITNEVRAFSGNQLETLLRSNTVQGCTIVLKKEVLDYAFPFQKDVLYDWWLAICAARMGSIGYIHQNLIYHRRHSKSSHYSVVSIKSKTEALLETKNILDLVYERIALTDQQLLFVERFQSVLKKLMTNKFSFSAFVFYFKNGNYFYSRRAKKFPYLSYMLRSFKDSFGALK